jgi:hypothetical protein
MTAIPRLLNSAFGIFSLLGLYANVLLIKRILWMCSSGRLEFLLLLMGSAFWVK